MDDKLHGIPRVDLETRPRWKRDLAWWFGGKVLATARASAIWRKIAMPYEVPLIKATGGRARLSVGIPIAVLTSTGARSGKTRQTALAYFTDGDDVVLIASNYGQARHPGWYHNLRAHPECELYVGRRGGRFVAREVDGPQRDRLYALAASRLYPGWVAYEKRAEGVRRIPVLRLTPADPEKNSPHHVGSSYGGGGGI
ncbi:nitroreductase family deazaflavin-dependent oxidoreductase [Mycolicibacterium smegmatis]|nr:nitroreductase family deazaflavin-dependent oxidoreductase [Mycolicibacterium smegmatis]